MPILSCVMNYEYTYVLLSLLKMQGGILSLFIDKILVVAGAPQL